MRWQVYRLPRLIGKVVRLQQKGNPLMSCTPLPKAAKPVWSKQLTRLPCLIVLAKCNLCILLKAKWAVSFCWLPPGSGKDIQWVLRGKQRLPHNRLNPCCYLFVRLSWIMLLKYGCGWERKCGKNLNLFFCNAAHIWLAYLLWEKKIEFQTVKWNSLCYFWQK